MIIESIMGLVASAILAGMQNMQTENLEEVVIVQEYEAPANNSIQSTIEDSCTENFKLIECGSDMELLENRDGKLVIEMAVGVVLDEDGNGKIINCQYCPDCYIHYSCGSVGDVIESYFVYNPDTNYYDDIMDRYDYIIGHDESLLEQEGESCNESE